MNVEHFELARTMALKSVGKYRLGAVIAQGNRVVSAGFNNMSKTHPLMHKYNPKRYEFATGTHAEVMAMVGTERQHLRGAQIYVCRVLKNDDYALAKPCKVCIRIIKVMGISRVYYTHPHWSFTGGNFRELDLDSV